MSSLFYNAYGQVIQALGRAGQEALDLTGSHDKTAMMCSASSELRPSQDDTPLLVLLLLLLSVLIPDQR